MPNAKYQVNVISSRPGRETLTVSGWMPEDISFSVQSDWDQPFQEGNSKTQAILSTAGISTKLLSLSSQVWSGSSPVTLSIPLDFYAETNAFQEVVTPVQNLMQMALPDTATVGFAGGATFLVPPGPISLDAVNQAITQEGSSGDNIIISLGSFLRFSKVVVKSVTPSFSLKLSKEGHPMRARVEIEFSSFGTMTKRQLSTIFNT